MLLAVLLVAVPAASADCGGVVRKAAQRDAGPGRPPLAVGDSVMLGAVDELAAVGFDVDARGCRQMSEAVDVLRSRGRGLPKVVVVFVGANWTISIREVRAALGVVGPSRVLGLVTPRETGGGSGSDAAVVRAAGRRWPDRVRVLDWVLYTAGHGEWFASDGLHLGPGGADAMARLFRGALAWLAPPLGERWTLDPAPEVRNGFPPGGFA
ncbi:MAG: hypothetical protein ABWY95_06745 [Thermoleophilaceae bacterium]